MSKDTIYREDAIKAVDAFLGTDLIVERIKRLPSADRLQGKWVRAHEGTIANGLYCSNCGKHGYGEKYCPNCGARMKGADDERHKIRLTESL